MGKSKLIKPTGEEASPWKLPSSGSGSNQNHVDTLELQRLRGEVMDLQNKMLNYTEKLKSHDMTMEYDGFKTKTESILDDIDRKIDAVIQKQKLIEDKQTIIEAGQQKQAFFLDEMDQDRRYPCLLLHGVKDQMSMPERHVCWHYK
jgi:hypothetical protein